MMTQYTPLRRLNRIMLFGLIPLMLLGMLLAAAPALTAPPGTVDWDPGPQNVTRSSTKSVFPWAALDSNDKLHIMYATDNGDLWYVNNVDGTFSPPKRIDSAGAVDRLPFFALAVGPGNIVHVAYSLVGKDNQIYYRQATLNGATATFSSRQLISSGAKAYGANLTVDSRGTAHIVWIDKRCGNYNVYYRFRLANGDLSSTGAPKDDCTYQERPQVAVTNDGKAHIVFYRSNEIYYARSASSGGWVVKNLSATPSSFSGNPTITTDGTALYVAWDEGVNGHDIRFRRSLDGGDSWSNWIPFSDSSSFASFPQAAWSPTAKRAYVAWSDTSGTGAGQNEIWFREFNPATGETTAADRLSHLSGDSLLPVVTALGSRAEVVWQDKTTSTWQVYRWGGQVRPDACDGSLTLNGSMTLSNGIPATNQATITGLITPANCTPSQMQVSLDAPPTNATPKATYSSQISVPVPSSALTTCVHTVYVRLFAGGVGGAIFSKNIVVDTDVTAVVHAVNPYLNGLTPPPTDDGAQDGDPNYSRNGKAYMQIINTGDCVGLKEFSMPNNPVLAINGNFGGYVNLPDDQSQGSKTFQVSLKDKLNNVDLFPSPTTSFSLIYDTDPPQLNFSGSPEVDGPTTTDNIIVPLSFHNIHVSDNLYGTREGLPNDAQFWGVWVASSREASPNLATLKWYPVETKPGASFSIEWSLFSGLGYGTALNRSGDYYVFVKFLDGAGNASVQTIESNKITLSPNYTIPTLHFPLVAK